MVIHYGFIYSCMVYGVVRTTYTDSVWAIKLMKNTVHGNVIKTMKFDILSAFGDRNEENRRCVIYIELLEICLMFDEFRFTIK
jgi:hypothetical protein